MASLDLEPVAPSSMDFFDDFDRAGLGPNWILEGGSFSISSNVLTEDFGVQNFTSRITWFEPTATVDQYAKLELVDTNTDTFGFMFRNGDAGGHYEIHLPPATTQWRWEHFDTTPSFVERVDDCLGDQAFADGDWIGAAVEGTGTDTIVSVWRWDADPSPGPGYDAVLWGAPDCMMTANPTTPIDLGAGIGVRAHAGIDTAPALADNWSGGDLPPAAVCGDAIVGPGEDCEVNGDCGVQALFAFDLAVVDGSYPGKGSPGASAAGDIDGDGQTDVVSGGGGVLQWYKSPGFQRFAIDGGAGPDDPGSNGVQVFDIDGDNDLDVVSGLFDAGLAWWENPGHGAPAQGTWTRHTIDGTASGFLHDLVRGDIDGDPAEELVALYVGGEIYWYDLPVLPAAGPWPRTQILAGVADPYVGLALGDLDGDGDLDVVASNSWYEQPADPTTPNWTERQVFGSAVQNLYVADVDDDGYADVVGAEGFVGPNGRLLWAKAPSDPLTQPWTEVVVGSGLDGPENAWAGDLDADGDVDLMTGEMEPEDGFFDDGSNLLVYENVGGDGLSWTQVMVAQDVGVSARITPVDIDGDGDIDFTADGNAEDHIYLWRNGTLPASTPQACSSGCECIVAPECNNGIDDDEDGDTDYPADVNCDDLDDPTELPEPSALIMMLVGAALLARLERQRAKRLSPGVLR